MYIPSYLYFHVLGNFNALAGVAQYLCTQLWTGFVVFNGLNFFWPKRFYRKMRPSTSINLSGLLVVGADNQSQRSDGQEWWTDESHEIVSSDGIKVKKLRMVSKNLILLYFICNSRNIESIFYHPFCWEIVLRCTSHYQTVLYFH